MMWKSVHNIINLLLKDNISIAIASISTIILILFNANICARGIKYKKTHC